MMPLVVFVKGSFGLEIIDGLFLIVPPMGKSLSKPMGWLGCWEPPEEHLSLKHPLLDEVLEALDMDLLN